MNMEISYKINPMITEEELYDFYKQNTICEEGYGIDIATRVLSFTTLIVGAYDGEKLIGVTRSMFDGVTAEVVEFCLAVDYQGQNLVYENGSIVEKDDYGIALELGRKTLGELLNMGAYFVSTVAFEPAEKEVYLNVGFDRNDGHVNYVFERRPYVPSERHSSFI